MYQISRVIDRR